MTRSADNESAMTEMFVRDWLLLVETCPRSRDANAEISPLRAFGPPVEMTKRYAADLIHDVLALVQVDAGTAPTESVTFELRSLVDDVLSGLRLGDVRVNFPDAPLPIVRSNATRLRRVIANVLRQAMTLGESFVVHVDMAEHDGKPTLMLTTASEFATLDRDEREGLFDIETSPGRRLSITRRLSQSLGGELSVAGGALLRRANSDTKCNDTM